jgi:STE24 endopeptidase
MSYQGILYLLLGIITFDFLIDTILGHLNHKSVNKDVPKILAGIYNDEERLKSQSYQNENYKFGLLTGIISFIATFSILYFGGFGILDAWLRNFAPNELVLSLYFFGALFIISDITTLPFQLYSTFVIEAKYGFNKSTVKIFVLDKLKGYLLTLIIGGLLLSAFIYLVFAFGNGFWWVFWIIISVFTLLASVFYTSWILPIFNKLKPLEAGSLRTAIEDYASKVDFPLTNIMVIDGSKRSSKANAFFSGFGSKKKIVLYDTLIEKHTEEELVAILAHEVGHYKKKHVIQGIVLSIIQTGFLLFILSAMILNSKVTWAMGGETTAMHLNVLAFGILFSPISHIISLLMNLLSRKNEYEADAFAAQTYAAAPLKSALIGLSAHHLSNLTPHPAYVFMHYSHPPLLHRLQALDQKS